MRNKRLHTRLAKQSRVSSFARYLGVSRQGLYKALKQEKRNLWGLYARYTKEIFMLGEKVYYLKLSEKNPNIYDGVVIAETISKHGHRTYGIDTGSGTVYKESAYVFQDKELAKATFDVMLPMVKQIYEIQKEAQAKVDEIRNRLLGTPEFPEYAEKENEEN